MRKESVLFLRRRRLAEKGSAWGKGSAADEASLLYSINCRPLVLFHTAHRSFSARVRIHTLVLLTH